MKRSVFFAILIIGFLMAVAHADLRPIDPSPEQYCVNLVIDTVFACEWAASARKRYCNSPTPALWWEWKRSTDRAMWLEDTAVISGCVKVSPCQSYAFPCPFVPPPTDDVACLIEGDP